MFQAFGLYRIACSLAAHRLQSKTWLRIYILSNFAFFYARFAIIAFTKIGLLPLRMAQTWSTFAGVVVACALASPTAAQALSSAAQYTALVVGTLAFNEWNGAALIKEAKKVDRDNSPHTLVVLVLRKSVALLGFTSVHQYDAIARRHATTSS